jgi:carbon storage regulator CsrA
VAGNRPSRFGDAHDDFLRLSPANGCDFEWPGRDSTITNSVAARNELRGIHRPVAERASAGRRLRRNEVMLVLSRKEGQTIVIGEGIEIQVAAIQGNRVRIAVNAPRNVRVMRGELMGTDLVSSLKTVAEDRVPATSASHCV